VLNNSSYLLPSKAVERLWGCTHLPSGYESFETGAPIGEIWHNSSQSDPELLVKHIFTSERLSIQVHPGDDVSRERGYKRGKDEAWLVVHAESEAVIGIGFKREVTRSELLVAASNGEIESLLDWQPVKCGDFFYVRAGTVHAIGAGLTVIEVQQNLDLTYRLYDYGRPRKLHLEEGISVAELKPSIKMSSAQALEMGRSVLVAGERFVVEEWTLDQEVWAGIDGLELLFIPVEGAAFLSGETMRPGSVFSGNRVARVVPEKGFRMLVAYVGGSIHKDIFRHALPNDR
jgi:mannose-6-phosphate isomerase